ncbi:nicotinamide mononucleotide transporter [Nodosilinea sp. FACHB-131]|uniref:nicotinamide riboside transporter PnuC n=1 Tax=Cyanophyceae TaxID=3028117 RepID=UPI001689AADD|nr:nicotinamide riboside transporter PnuC [Nodosilinea sp. FACHB-131]MBD1874594.1 nicotinamide mononucleotide transporter [Nodosilinea sp. FACHB-131]
MADFLSINTIALTILGYPLSYIELIGTILYLWSVWLIAHKCLLTWPIGIISVLLYMSLFYQIQLYSDALEQVYYLVASVYGWWWWSRKDPVQDVADGFFFSPRRYGLLTLGITLGVGSALGGFMGQIHTWLPQWVPEAASFPILDAVTTVMSFTAMALMALKRIESWLYWIVVDVIAIGLYYVKEVRFLSLLYVILLGIAINGLVSWHQAYVASKAPGSSVG